MPESTNTPKVAVIGAGAWGRNLVRDFHGLGALALVCDASEAVLADVASKYPGTRVTRDFEAVLSDPGIKAVALATTAPTHAALALRCLNAGLDTFIEKPLALSPADGRAVVELARAKGRVLMVDHLLNRHPAVARLKAMIGAGELGRVVHVESARRGFGTIRVEENALWSLAPHDVCLVLAMAGGPPASVQAAGGGWLTPGVEDAATAHLRFEGGATGLIGVSWLHPIKERRLCVVGLEAMAVFDDMAPWGSKLVVYRHKIRWRGRIPKAEAGEAVPVPLTEVSPLTEQCRTFLEAVASRVDPPDSHGLEALEVLATLAALDESLKDGGLPKSLAAADSLPAYQAHPTAVVEPGAVVGAGTRIWNFSRVLSGSVVGPDVNIGQNVVVGPRAKVGRGCKIQNNVSVYEGVELAEEVFCGPSMVFTNVHNPRAFIKRMGELRTTRVGRGATIGANATIVCGHDLGEYCLVGAGAVVAKDVPAHALMAGVPARRIGWVCRCGVKLPESLVCPACSAAYQETPSGLAPTGGS
jgi:UDP-2-acetamido-3-amino-2,3-dideoxy-glucuronate N-acetyltransferase